MKYIGDFLFWIFIFAMVVVFIRDQSNAVALTKGMVGSSVDLATGLANLGGPAPGSYSSA